MCRVCRTKTKKNTNDVQIYDMDQIDSHGKGKDMGKVLFIDAAASNIRVKCQGIMSRSISQRGHHLGSKIFFLLRISLSNLGRNLDILGKFRTRMNGKIDVIIYKINCGVDNLLSRII